MAGVKGLFKGQVAKGQQLAAAGADAAAKPFALVGAQAAAKPLLRAGARLLPFVGSGIAAAMAWDDFKHGRWIQGVFNTIGMIPGPVGWLGMGAAFVTNLFSHGSSPYGLWDAPDGVSTFMLPAAAKEDANVLAVDAALAAAQKEVFGFADGPSGTVWNSNPPAPLRLDTPEVKQALREWLVGISNQFQQIDATMAASGEPYIAEWRQKIAPQLEAMRKLPDHAKAIEAQLDAASDAAARWYSAVLQVNKTARTQLAQNGTLTDIADAQSLQTTRASSQTAIDNASQKLADLLRDTQLSQLATPARTAPAHNTEGAAAAAPAQPLGPTAPWTPSSPLLPAEQPAPAPVAGAPVAAVPVPDKKDAQQDDLSKFLSALRTPAISPMGNPMGGMPMGGMPLGGAPMGGGTPLGTPGGPSLGGPPKGTPLTDQKINATPVAKRDLAGERPKLSAEPAENKVVPGAKPEAKADAAEVKPDAVAPVAAGPGHPTGPTGGPGVKPAAASKPADTSVDVKGSKITFPDAKTAALAKELATGGPNHPVSLADAATKAGLVAPVPGQDPGQQVAPSDAKPGDLLRAGDRDYMLMGDGKFLDFTGGKVVDADQMPKDLGANGGYFHLRDAAGSDPSGAGPVSGPAPAVTTTTVADGPTVPTDGSQPAPVVGAPAAGAPGSSVPPSTGTPGVPEKGPAGAGPTNAAATETGRGQGAAPVVGSKPLDPTSIA